MTQKLLGGWQLAGSAILQAGNPINVTNGATFPTGDFNADGTGGDRPNTPAAGIKTSGWSVDEYLAGIFRAADFPVPARGTNGNLVRNAYRGPGYADVSLSLSKRFNLTAEDEHRGPHRRVQRAEPRQPRQTVDRSEQRQLRQIDRAAEHARDPARVALRF